MIDREQVAHVAKLARLEFDASELDTLAGELSAILDHVDRLGTVDVTEVPPTTHVIDLGSVLRQDVPGPELERSAALAPAPATEDGAFLVPSPQRDE